MKKSVYVLLFIFTLVLVEGIWCGFNDAYNRSYAAEIEKDIPVNDIDISISLSRKTTDHFYRRYTTHIIDSTCVLIIAK